MSRYGLIAAGLAVLFCAPGVTSSQELALGTGSLTTLFAADNEFAGNTFDIVPNVALTITSFDVNLTDGEATTMAIYWRNGTADGNESNPAGWKLIGTDTVTPNGTDIPTPVAIGGLELTAGQTYGFYVDVQSYPSSSLEYTNGGPTTFSNADMDLTTFHGKGTPAFTDETYFPRQWNGTVYYELRETEVFSPAELEVDYLELASDGNGVFEPGELVDVAPAWIHGGAIAHDVQGSAASFMGPAGPMYDLVMDQADYGLVDPTQTASCRDVGVCYQMGVGPEGVERPALHWDATFDETLSEESAHTWTLHLGDSFADVPRTSGFYSSVETMLHHGVTGGCSATGYCPGGLNTRAQMPVFVLRALEGADYVPPACEEGSEVFGDVPFDHQFCPWIEELANRGVIAGCGGGNYCLGNPVTRAQMAVFLLRTLEGSGYTPPACTGLFVDVACPSSFADWIEDLYNRGITGGCTTKPLSYCPANPVNRQQMAIFVGRAFGLTLYGP